MASHNETCIIVQLGNTPADCAVRESPCMIVQFKTSDLKFGVTSDLKFDIMSDLKFDVTSDLKFGVTPDLKFDVTSLANLYN